MANFLIIGANSKMVENLIIDINTNQENKLYLFVNNSEKFYLSLGTKLDLSRINLYKCDLYTDDIYEQLNSIKDTFDAFCYVSGITKISLVKFLKKEDIESVFEINFFKPLFITQHLLKYKLLKNNSNVVFVSSISGIGNVAAGITTYSTSKAALNNLVKVLTIECKNLKIKFNTVCPGIVDTKFNIDIDNLKTNQEDQLIKRYPLGYGVPSDIDSLIKYLLIDNTWISGQNIIIDGGFNIN
jgi:NAD(P)-dependent dehydrogenase (short-subunit alcohol dehydrogenase family)